MIDVRQQDAAKKLRALAPGGLDAVLAFAGGEELERCLDFMRPRGRVVHPNGVEPAPADRETFHVRSYDAIASPREFAKLNRHISNRRLRVPIAASYPLRRAAVAHRRLERTHVIGRMVLQMHPGKEGRS